MWHEAKSNYDQTTRVETLVYGEGKQRYGFSTLDPSQPLVAGEKLYTEEHLFPDYDWALFIYLDYLEMGYLVGPFMDYAEQIMLAEQWIPPLKLAAEQATSGEFQFTYPTDADLLFKSEDSLWG